MNIKRCISAAGVCLALGGGALQVAAEPPWEVIARDHERVAEIDRSSVLQSDGGSKVAWARIVLQPERAEKDGYASVKALNRYDCYNRSFYTIKRVYFDARHIALREESGVGETPVLAAKNSVDERLWQEVCRPPGMGDLQRVAADVAKIAAAAQGDTQGGASQKRSGTGKAAVTDASSKKDGRERTTSRRLGSKNAASKVQEWSFEGSRGPAHWGRLKRAWAQCATGRLQAPIDIRDATPANFAFPRFDYSEQIATLVDIGYTFRLLFPSGMGVSIDEAVYRLEAVDFYWPSQVRLGGRAADLEVHLLHRASDGREVIVAVLFESGQLEHPGMQFLLEQLPVAREGRESERPFNPIALLPSSGEHYRFMGSHVTPPCAEGVQWIVMRQIQQLSVQQLDLFRARYPRNTRPIQPSNGRSILNSP